MQPRRPSPRAGSGLGRHRSLYLRMRGVSDFFSECKTSSSVMYILCQCPISCMALSEAYHSKVFSNAATMAQSKWKIDKCAWPTENYRISLFMLIQTPVNVLLLILGIKSAWVESIRAIKVLRHTAHHCMMLVASQPIGSLMCSNRIHVQSRGGKFRTLKRRRRYFTYSRCMFNRDCSTTDMPGYRHLKQVRIVAPPLSVVATCSHAIQSVLELVSGQCRPLPDKGFTMFIKFYFDIA